MIKKCANIAKKHSITIDEVNLGIGDTSVKLVYNKKDQEIAYKLWVELSTRKIGLPFDQENDVISEVYNSWYDFFKIARELLKEIPVSRLPYSNDLIKLTEKVLNTGLRPHLKSRGDFSICQALQNTYMIERLLISILCGIVN